MYFFVLIFLIFLQMHLLNIFLIIPKQSVEKNVFFFCSITLCDVTFFGSKGLPAFPVSSLIDTFIFLLKKKKRMAFLQLPKIKNLLKRYCLLSIGRKCEECKKKKMVFYFKSINNLR